MSVVEGKAAQWREKVTYFYRTMQSPVGELKLVGTDKGLTAVLWENDDPKRVPLRDPTENLEHPILNRSERQLKEYFAGTRTAFDLDLEFIGTEFEKKVWSALLNIPFGETRSYAEIATAIGKPGSARAVGRANSRNPISIVAPCHRVIGSNGDLTGFAGGLDAKRFLLSHEEKRQRPAMG